MGHNLRLYMAVLAAVVLIVVTSSRTEKQGCRLDWARVLPQTRVQQGAPRKVENSRW